MLEPIFVYRLLILYLSFVIPLRVESLCPPRNSSSDPSFQVEPPKTVSGVSGLYLSVDCCVDGYSTLLWSFRKLNNPHWRHNFSNVRLKDKNRTLDILEAYAAFDQGFYRCFAEDKLGRNVSRTIFVYMLNKDENKTINILTPKVSPSDKLSLGDSFNIVCSGHTYEPDLPVSVSWSFQQKKKVIPKPHSINTTRIRAANRFLELNPDFLEITSTLTLRDVTEEFSGNYTCNMAQNGTEKEITFHILVIDDRINLGFLILLVTMITFTFISCLLVWHFHYHIILLYKSYLDPCPRGSNKRIDVSVLYEDLDMEGLLVSLHVINSLEELGFRCWHFDRNKNYGGDIMEDFVRVFNKSHVVLIILSRYSATEGSLLAKLSSIRPDPAVRRLYVFLPSRNTIFHIIKEFHARLLRWMNQELRLQSFFQRKCLNFEVEHASKYHYKRILTWTMTSLPSSSLRGAKDRTKNLTDEK